VKSLLVFGWHFLVYGGDLTVLTKTMQRKQIIDVFDKTQELNISVMALNISVKELITKRTQTTKPTTNDLL
jgi:lipid-A-disaccharide synthase-like uncharacterized protein